MEQEHLLQVRQLTTAFKSYGESVKILDGLSFSLKKGEVLGIVGESGCGKSLTALSIMRLIKPPGRIVGGEIIFRGIDLLALKKHELRRIRGNQIAMIFQEPMTALNPVYSIGNQMEEVLKSHTELDKKSRLKRLVELLDEVGIPRAEAFLHNFPHQLSGGMRQRVMIAMAMSCSPELLIADEPTTALDVTIQAQILELIRGLQRDSGMSVLLITHNLGVVSEMCDRVIVMYAGRIVESAPARSILDNPQHPYTQGLLASLPRRGLEQARLNYIPGYVPPASRWAEGCRFIERCSSALERCRTEAPSLTENGEGHWVSCWRKGGECHG